MDDATSLKNKILTVSIAAYNVEKTIGETLESLLTDIPDEILEQLEIIVVNDGSQDRTAEIVRKYVDKYPETVFLINKENAGWGSTVNASIDRANGKYLKLLDGDDWFLTENLSEYIQFLREADADLVMSPYVKSYPDKKFVEDNHVEIGSEVSSIEKIHSDVDIYMHELSVKIDNLRRGEVQIAEKCFYTDNEFAFEAIRCSDTVQRYDKPVYVYRLGDAEQSVGINGIRRHYRDTMVVAERIFESFKRCETERKCPDAKLALLTRKIILITDALYVSYLLMDSWETKKELMDFDSMIKSKYTRVYKLTNEVKKIKMLRLSGFTLYGFMARKVKQRYGV